MPCIWNIVRLQNVVMVLIYLDIPGGHHGAGHLVAGHCQQVQAPIRAPYCCIGIAVVHSKAGYVALQGDGLPHLALGNVVHVQAGALGYHQILLGCPEMRRDK